MSGLGGPRRHPRRCCICGRTETQVTGSLGMDDEHQAPILNGRIEGDTIRLEQDANELRVNSSFN